MLFVKFAKISFQATSIVDEPFTSSFMETANSQQRKIRGVTHQLLALTLLTTLFVVWKHQSNHSSSNTNGMHAAHNIKS